MTFKELVEQSQEIDVNYKVTPEVYYSFQRMSNDYNPLHTDEAFAKQKGFLGRVMYGNILNAFISHFVGMLLPTREIIIQSQDINYHRPVFLNDEIQLEAKIDNVSEAVSIINYKFKFSKIGSGKAEIIAKGHVQVGLLKGKEEFV